MRKRMIVRRLKFTRERKKWDTTETIYWNK